MLVGDEVQDFHRGLFVGEVSSVPDRSSEACVEALDGVGRVHDAAQLGWELEERDELVPRGLPRSDHGRVLLSPAVGELGEQGFGCRQRGGGVDLAHLAGDRRPVFLGDVAQRVANEVHDTGLHGRVGPCRRDTRLNGEGLGPQLLRRRHGERPPSARGQGTKRDA